MNSNKEEIKLDENDIKHLANALKDTNLVSNLLQYYENTQQLNNTGNNDDSISPQNVETPSNVTSSNSNLKTKKVKVIPAFCFKTHSNRNDKVYVQISHYYSIEAASTSSDGGWIIPHSIYPIEQQKASITGKSNKVFHIVFGSETFKEAMKNRGLHTLLTQSAIKSIYQNYNESLNIAAYKMSKKVFYKEIEVSEIPEPEVNLEEPMSKETTNEDGTITPLFNIIKLDDKQQIIKNPIIIPTTIKIEILLSKLENINNLYIEIIDQKLILQEDNVNYSLNIPFSHIIDEENHIAKFNKKTKLLTITVNVIDHSSEHQHQHNQHNHHHHNHSNNSNINNDIIDIHSIPFPTTFVKNTQYPSYLYKQTKEQLTFIIYNNKKDNLDLHIDNNILEMTIININQTIKLKLFSNVVLDHICYSNTIIVVFNKEIKQWWKTLVN